MLLPKPPKRKPWQYERPNNDKMRALLAQRCQEQGVEAPAALHGVEVEPAPRGESSVWVVVLADAWTRSPRDGVRVGDGVCGCKVKVVREGGTKRARVRWAGLVMDVMAWDRGEARAAMQRNGRRGVEAWAQHPEARSMILHAQKLGHIAPHKLPDPAQAPVVFAYRVALLAEGDLGDVTIPKGDLALWTM